MKIEQLTEALEAAGQAYKNKFGIKPHIWNLRMDEDDEQGNYVEVELCKRTVYDDQYGGSATGKKPLATAKIRFYCDGGEITDRAVELVVEGKD